jgi:nucleoside-diphosphate-sugar epimerase
MNPWIAPRVVYILSRGMKAFYPAEWSRVKIKEIRCDIHELTSLPSDIDYVIHAATSTQISESENFKYLSKTILSGTERLLGLCEKVEIKHFFYVSSGAVYGLHHSKDIDLHEECDFAPKVTSKYENYGHFKRIAELYVADYHARSNVPTTIGRLFSFSGADLSLDAPLALVQFLKQALKENKIVVKGDGSALRSYMDQVDMVNWILTMLNRSSGVEIFNIGSDCPISVLSLAKKMVSLVGPCSIEVVGDQSQRSNFYIPNVDKAKQFHGLKLNKSLDESVLSMISSKRFHSSE